MTTAPTRTALKIKPYVGEKDLDVSENAAKDFIARSGNKEKFTDFVHQTIKTLEENDSQETRPQR